MAAQPSRAALLVHNVYFLLHDRSAQASKKLIDDCKKYLTEHPGTVFFAVGTVSELDRPVNDRDFDVGLHVIFENRQAHDDYQVAPRHIQFVEANKASWAKVRVFDSDAEQG
jgi:hypothetical protein